MLPLGRPPLITLVHEELDLVLFQLFTSPDCNLAFVICLRSSGSLSSNSMASLSATGLRSDVNPSIPDSDTPYASSDLSPSHTKTSVQPPVSQVLADIPLARETSLTIQRPRGLSIVSSSSSSARRKPLPATASPLATRYLSGDYSTTSLDSPDARFSRRISIDSPTLYEDTSIAYPVPPIAETFLTEQKHSR